MGGQAARGIPLRVSETLQPHTSAKLPLQAKLSDTPPRESKVEFCMDLNQILLLFTALFAMVNPIASIPVFSALTLGYNDLETRKIAIKACLFAGLALLFFAYTGDKLFEFFGLSLDSLRIVGGIIFFLIGFDMLKGRFHAPKRNAETAAVEAADENDIAIAPLGIPIVGGPGAIAVTMIAFEEASSLTDQIALTAAVVAILVLTAVIFITGERLLKLLGESGTQALLRLMGLIVMMLATEFFFTGLGPKIVAISQQL